MHNKQNKNKVVVVVVLVVGKKKIGQELRARIGVGKRFQVMKCDWNRIMTQVPTTDLAADWPPFLLNWAHKLTCRIHWAAQSKEPYQGYLPSFSWNSNDSIWIAGPSLCDLMVPTTQVIHINSMLAACQSSIGFRGVRWHRANATSGPRTLEATKHKHRDGHSQVS
jgi:hypothetical protein